MVVDWIVFAVSFKAAGGCTLYHKIALQRSLQTAQYENAKLQSDWVNETGNRYPLRADLYILIIVSLDLPS